MIFLHIDRLLPGPKGENGNNRKYCRNRNRNGNRNRNRNRNVQKKLKYVRTPVSCSDNIYTC